MVTKVQPVNYNHDNLDNWDNGGNWDYNLDNQDSWDNGDNWEKQMAERL